MSSKLCTIIAACTLAVACSKGPEAKAPGTDPEDMTPEGHAAAAESEGQQAQEHKQMGAEAAEDYGGRADVPDHAQQADQHERHSEQHKAAGAQASDGGAPKK